MEKINSGVLNLRRSLCYLAFFEHLKWWSDICLRLDKKVQGNVPPASHLLRFLRNLISRKRKTDNTVYNMKNSLMKHSVAFVQLQRRFENFLANAADKVY